MKPFAIHNTIALMKYLFSRERASKTSIPLLFMEVLLRKSSRYKIICHEHETALCEFLLLFYFT